MKLLIVCGLPGTGKLTIAKEISKISNVKIINNKQKIIG